MPRYFKYKSKWYIITIKTKCDLVYTNHNYIKEINAYNLIKNDEVNEDNMKEEIPL